MFFCLVKDLSKITDYYGNVPEIYNMPEDSYEEYVPELESDRDLLLEDFCFQINDACGSSLDFGDVDYFDSGQSALLKNWLLERLDRTCPVRLQHLYHVLLDYASRAIALETGVIVEL